MKKYIATSVLLTVFLTACFDFEANHMVTKLEILAVQANPPQINPGDGFDLEVLWADPEGAGRTVQFAWVLCGSVFMPVLPMEGLSTCEMLGQPIVATSENDGQFLDVPMTPPDIFDSLPDGLPPSTDMWITAVVIMCADGQLPTAAELPNHFDEPLINDLCVGGTGISAFKSVRVTRVPEDQVLDTENGQTLVDLNTNPYLETVTFNGQPIDFTVTEPLTVDCPAADDCDVEVDIVATMTDDSYQTYQVEEFDKWETVDEKLYVTWFTTGGEYDGDRSLSDNFKGPYELVWNPKKPGLYDLWFVAHDVRGGNSWESVQVNARVPAK